MNAEDLKLTRLKKETLIFSFFLIFLINILFFKKAFLQYGFSVAYGNNPLNYTFDVFQIIYLLGIIPLILGIFGLYQGFFKLKKEPIILISSMILGVLFLLLFNIITFEIGLLFLSFGLVISSSLAIKNLFIYLDKTKASHLKKSITVLFVLLFVVLSLIPTYTGYKKEFVDLSDFEWIKENSNRNDVILTYLDHGHLVTYFNERQNFIDDNFLLAPDPHERLNDVNLIYSGWSYNKALEILHEYSVDYIYINEDVKKFYNIDDLEYIQDGECIREVKRNIYKVVC